MWNLQLFPRTGVLLQICAFTEDLQTPCLWAYTETKEQKKVEYHSPPCHILTLQHSWWNISPNHFLSFHSHVLSPLINKAPVIYSSHQPALNPMRLHKVCLQTPTPSVILIVWECLVKLFMLYHHLLLPHLLSPLLSWGFCLPVIFCHVIPTGLCKMQKAAKVHLIYQCFNMDLPPSCFQIFFLFFYFFPHIMFQLPAL